jgi:sulfite reductase (NADPH) flavoprotein alpha-component
MTKVAFPGAGLTPDQWAQVNTLAVSLQPEQAIWLSGYFAGIGQNVRGLGSLADLPPLRSEPTPPPTTNAATRALTILVASETGNGMGLAKALAEAAQRTGLAPRIVDMADYKPRALKDEQDVLVVTATHGEGDPPRPGVGFFEFVEGRRAPQLPQMRYAVLALGDSTYERYCEAGKRIDRRLEELGAVRLQARVDCDVDFEEPANAWIASVLAKLSPAASPQPTPTRQSASAQPAPFDKHTPFPAPILDNIVLTGRGSSKETRHIELSLAGSGLTFEPGDALGLLPRNDAALVESMLGELSLSADAALIVKQQSTTLGAALSSFYEIATATPRFIDHWATLSGATALEKLRGDEGQEARTAFLRGHHVIDIVRRFPVAGVDARTLVAGLRPLQPRLYSIASSLAAMPEEAHLTVSTVRYELNGEARAGIASGYLADHGAPDTTLPVYIQSNPHFRLADDETPMLMIGAGTGVAPYRAFLQEREARGARGKSWLVFGDRNFRSDFLYQTEWQEFLKNGVLSRMNVAFSRDGATKTYVQDRLREQAKDVYAWLEDGARIYVCGDAARLAPDVRAGLAAIVQQERVCDADAADDYLRALERDRRYQTDVY